MPKFEPFWNPEHEDWPGKYDCDGKRRMGDILYDTHVGVWCDWRDLGGLGIVATDEFQFTEDGRFVWLSMGEPDGKDVMVRREGTWDLSDEVLSLRITFSEEPDCSPRERSDMRISNRQGRLGLQMIRLDDEVRENVSYFLLPAREGDSVRVLEAAVARKRRPQGALQPPFSTLEPLLKMTIASAVEKLQLPDPIFCMRIYYYDTHAPREDYGFVVRVLTEPLRRNLAARHSSTASLAWELWPPQSGASNGTPGRDVGLYEIDLTGSRELTKLFAKVYDLLCESEDDHMPQLRELARRTAKALNARTWGRTVAVTDDLVIFPADGSGFFGGDFEYLDDLEAAIPPERVDLLRQRGYLT